MECGTKPLQLNFLTRALSQGFLKLAKSKAQSKGADISYSFGDEKMGTPPSAAGPMLKVDRVFRTDRKVQLPICNPPAQKGTWHWNGEGSEQWTPIDRPDDLLDTAHWFTICLN